MNWIWPKSEINYMSLGSFTKDIRRDPQGHSVPEDGRIYSEQLHEQIGAELFIKQVEIPQETIAFVKSILIFFCIPIG